MSTELPGVWNYVRKLRGWLVKRPDDENDLFFEFGREFERDEYIRRRAAETTSEDS